MKNTRRKFSAKFKATVAIEAIKERASLSELAKRYELHANQIAKWKREFLENSEAAFETKVRRTPEEEMAGREQLYAKIGQLEMERDFLKKSLRKAGLA
jgi:transposase-like protein